MMTTHVAVPNELEWKKEATRFMKSVMARNGVKYEDLVDRLKEIGVEETYVSVLNKINRGAFSFAFFMQCMRALGVKDVHLER